MTIPLRKNGGGSDSKRSSKAKLIKTAPGDRRLRNILIAKQHERFHCETHKKIGKTNESDTLRIRSVPLNVNCGYSSAGASRRRGLRSSDKRAGHLRSKSVAGRDGPIAKHFDLICHYSWNYSVGKRISTIIRSHRFSSRLKITF